MSVKSVKVQEKNKKLTKVPISKIKNKVKEILVKNTIDTQKPTDFSNNDNVSYFEQEAEVINKLRKSAARAINLVKLKFNLTAFRLKLPAGTQWYSSTKVTRSDIVACVIKFSSQECAAKAESYLRSENYQVTQISEREISINLVKTPEEIIMQKHEETSNITKTENIVEQLKEALDKARTSHLTSEQIISRIWKQLQIYNIILVDTTKKITMADVIEGCKLAEEKDMFTIIVNEALV